MVILECQFSQQVQHLVMLECHFPGAAFGDVGVSLFMAGAAFGEICSGSAKCCNLEKKMRLQSAKNNLGKRAGAR